MQAAFPKGHVPPGGFCIVIVGPPSVEFSASSSGKWYSPAWTSARTS
ncbi:MAG TPA: hypothetical protein VL119_01410 [Acidimicrobiia bacterium]|nr:hypothetical protein [Acidimicrobiia bacterium]